MKGQLPRNRDASTQPEFKNFFIDKVGLSIFEQAQYKENNGSKNGLHKEFTMYGVISKSGA